MFSELPPDTGLAFVVVQHLSPDFRSLMDELIARHSDMPVRLVEDGMPVEHELTEHDAEVYVERYDHALYARLRGRPIPPSGVSSADSSRAP